MARSKPAKPPLYDEQGKPVLELNEEAYHFDPVSGLIRRLSDTGGRIAGIYVDRPRKQLILLIVDGLLPSETDSGLGFSALSVATVSLETLDGAGPVRLPVNAPLPEVTICTSAKGEALWVTNVSHALDATRKSVAEVPDGCAPSSGVRVTPYRATRLHARAETSVDESGVITVATDGGASPIRISHPQRLDSIGWSPNRTRLVYAGEMDPCSLEAAGWPRTGLNELYVWDAGTRKATRLATAFSFFGWEWLDDDHLIYETGTKANAKVALRDFHAQGDTVIDTRAGAGLNAVPILACVGKTVGEEEEESAD